MGVLLTTDHMLMSRAFVKEQDGSEIPADAPERPVSEQPNLVTPHGLQLIERRIRELQAQRDTAKQSEENSTVASIERDLRYWLKRKASAQVVQAEPSPTKVRFGVRVKLRYEDGREQTFALVGEDEADPAAGLISWASPIAQALLGCEVGNEPLLQGQRAEILELSPLT